MPFSTRKPHAPEPSRPPFLARALDSLPFCAATGAFVGLLISFLFM